MGIFNKDAKERFEEEMKANSPVAADEIQDTVDEVGKGRGLGAQIKKKETRSFSLSKAGENLYGASQAALDQQEKLKLEREEAQKQRIEDTIKSVIQETEKETQKYLPKGESLGQASYLTPEEQRQRSITYSLTQEEADFSPSGLDIKLAYKDYAKGGSRAIADYNPNYGIDATKAATPFTHITFHHTASGKKQSDDGVVASGQRLNSNGEQLGYHFYIGRDLKIRQGAPLNKRTNHIGGTNRYFERANKKDKTFTEEQALELLKNQKTAFNENSIGIGIVAADDADIDPKQIELAMKLTQALSDQFNINPKNVGGHGHLDNQDKRLTEGTSATVAWKKLKELEPLGMKYLP